MISVRLIPALLVLGILVSLTSCRPMTGSPAPASEIQDIPWKLTAYGDRTGPQDIIPDTEITVLFHSNSGEVQGFGGCNGYDGNYEINGVRLTVSGLISTKMYCTNPPGVSNQENSYFETLQAAESFEITSSTLRINSGSQVLIYTR
jgi:heat shock protein HslJ